MKYLVTGGAGFIGSHVADKLLLCGDDVVVIDNFNNYYDPDVKEDNVRHNLSNPHYTLYRADIEDAQALQKIFKEQGTFSGIIHLAARAGVRPSLTTPSDYIRTNIIGTVNILECMKTFQIKKLIMASSSSVYGNSPAAKFNELLETNRPISPYAATKSACEEFCYTYHHLYNINIVLLRFFTVYGPRQRPDLAIHKFAKRILNDEPIQIYGDAYMQRDYTFIDDIVNGIESALTYDKTGYEIINLGGGRPVTVKEVITTLEKVLNKKAKISIIGKQAGDVDKTISDNTKANRLLNYVPKTSLEQGLQRFVDWMKSSKNKEPLNK